MVPAAAAAPAGQTMRPAAAGGLATVRAKHARYEQPESCAFGKPACTCLGCRCQPRKHFERSFFCIVTKATNVQESQEQK